MYIVYDRLAKQAEAHTNNITQAKEIYNRETNIAAFYVIQ